MTEYSLADVPDDILEKMDEPVRKAMRTLLFDDLRILKVNYFPDGTKRLGFIGPGGKFCRFANPEKSRALEIIEIKILEDIS